MPVSIAKVVKRIAMSRRVVMVNEWLTSQVCACTKCHEHVKCHHGERYYKRLRLGYLDRNHRKDPTKRKITKRDYNHGVVKCRHCTHARCAHESKEQYGRDTNAAQNIRLIAASYLAGLGRPAHLCIQPVQQKDGTFRINDCIRNEWYDTSLRDTGLTQQVLEAKRNFLRGQTAASNT